MLLARIITLAVCVFALPLYADEIRTTHSDQTALSVTIYNQNLALIKDQRSIELPSGESTLAFREVSARIRPETALLSGKGTKVLEQNFEYDLLNPESLLKKYVGRDISVIRVHPVNGEEQSETARVLAANRGVVLRLGKGKKQKIETGFPGRMVFPDVPKTLRDRPTLTMRVKSETAGSRELELSYLSSGLSWKADYVAELTPDDHELDLSGWVTLNNESGAAYPDALLQLVAGDVNTVRQMPEISVAAQSMPRAKTAATDSAMSEESMFEYHLYTLDRPTNIADKQSKQVALLQAADVVCDKEYLLAGRNYYYHSRAGELGEKLKVDVFVELSNKKEKGLGMPLPAGVVRVYKKDSKGRLQFVGEDNIDHTPEDKIIRLGLGKAFDITADKKQTDFRRLAAADQGSPYNQAFESAYEIVLKNAKAVPVTVKIEEPVPGDWAMVEQSDPHIRESSNTAVWRLEIPAKGSRTLSYRVRVRL